MAEPITIVGVEIRNFRKITLAHVKLDDKSAGLVKVTGKNKAGKTTLLNAIKAALGGARAIDEGGTISDEPTDDQSFVQVLLSNGFTITRRFTPASEKGALTIESLDGGKYGQKKLDEWLGARSFDPLAFYDLKPDDRAKLLLSLSPKSDLPETLANIRATRKEAYDKRTPHIAGLRAARTVKKPEGERPEPVDVSKELVRLQGLRAEQKRIDAAERVLSDAESTVRLAVVRVNEAQAALDRAREALLSAEEARDDAAEELSVLPADRKEAIAAVEAHLSTAAEADAALEPWKMWDRAVKEAEQHSERVDEFTLVIEGCDSAERRELQEAEIPVSNLTFDPEGAALINGKPFELASGAEKIAMAVDVAFAAKPDLRIALLDEANDLDLEALAELDRLAKEKGFQVWAVRIGIEGKGDVHVEDGVAQAAIEFA